ncbi:MAG: hypothetical protein LBH09_05495 [Peptococcaceae bacterium]|jgi:pyruvate,water dikinase|nr:hypothetical protein [Peptococcaceae bacterium]
MMNKPELTVLDNSNIVESYPGVTLPLTISFVKKAYSGVFKGAIGASLKNNGILSQFEPVFENMLADYQGRIYYRINNWYSLIDFMPFSKKITPIWQDMMGVQSKEVYLGAQYKFTVWQKAKLYINLLINWLRVPRDMKQLEQDFAGVLEYYNTTYSESLSIGELLALYHEIEHRVLDKWYVTLYNDMYAFIWTGLLKSRLAGKGADVARYISGITSLESLKPIRDLLAITQKYGDDADILANPEVQRYIKIYGDRSPCELKLETATYREDPSLLEKQIRDYASDKTKLADMICNLDKSDAPEVKGGFFAKRAQIGIRNREVSRLNRSRIYGMIRRICNRIGGILCREEWIDEGFDVFYLDLQEIEDGDYRAFREAIARRKADYEEFEKLPGHTRLLFRGDRLIDGTIAESWTGSFHGVGTSMGSVTAEAVVLDAPDRGIDVKGKIIVTKTTDPGWVFLLAMASGIIAEKGSLLSHTAIVSRELNIPAVVAVDGATAAIKTGDIVKLDGYTGRVEIVQAN